jgi:hypothetical protein
MSGNYEWCTECGKGYLPMSESQRRCNGCMKAGNPDVKKSTNKKHEQAVEYMKANMRDWKGNGIKKVSN